MTRFSALCEASTQRPSTPYPSSMSSLVPTSRLHDQEQHTIYQRKGTSRDIRFHDRRVYLHQRTDRAHRPSPCIVTSHSLSASVDPVSPCSALLDADLCSGSDVTAITSSSVSELIAALITVCQVDLMSCFVQWLGWEYPVRAVPSCTGSLWYCVRKAPRVSTLRILIL